MTATADHHGLVPVRSGAADSLPLLSQRLMRANFLITFVLSPPHSFWSCMPPSVSFSPNATQFVIYSTLPHSILVVFHSLQHYFFSFPFPIPHISQSSPSQSVSFISTLANKQNKDVAPKAISLFLRKQARNDATQRKHPPRGLSMYLFPRVVFISHKK